MSSTNCCFLTYIQVPQETGQVVWYSHLFQNFPQFIVIHTVKVFGIVKNLPPVQETWVRFLGQEDSPGEGNGNPLQYSCLENPMDKGVWWAVVHGVARVAHGLATNPPGADRSMLETDTM